MFSLSFRLILFVVSLVSLPLRLARLSCSLCKDPRSWCELASRRGVCGAPPFRHRTFCTERSTELGLCVTLRRQGLKYCSEIGAKNPGFNYASQICPVEKWWQTGCQCCQL
ncbi:hypothetical protein IscW_ISCW013062 [Ixodes scapularis]|uniref:Secreted protein n=1 Tax=Ixodes scapularis TaxID=6945 RepID=B7QBH3_IXOSC|nr:hypothetical protein IscW_ISCW013062 [Ixodes scapularis]|eukprot:XP_002412899.1 hypothetical protein IscW_ISCW013062 [Ixodes scapularis]